MSRRILGIFQIATLLLATGPGCDGKPADAARDGGTVSASNDETAQQRTGEAKSAAKPTEIGENSIVDTAVADPNAAEEEAPLLEARREDKAATATPFSAMPKSPPPHPGPMGRAGKTKSGGWGGGLPAADGAEAGNTESYDHIAENEFIAVADDARSTFSIDVDTASYSNMRRFLKDGQLPPADSVRIEELVNYFDYEYAAPTGKEPFSMTSEVSSCPWNDENLLVHVGLQGVKMDLSELPGRNLVFLLDVSGSMESADKLPLVREGMAMLAETMRKQDRISIVVYAGASGVVLEPTNDKAEILAAIQRLQAGGSTNGGAGIELAYKLAEQTFVKGGINRVVLATDGDFNVGTTSEGDLVRLIEEKRKSGVFLSVLGFGTGNLKDATMEKLADKGNGNYAYIDSMLEAKKVLVEEGGSTLVTIAKDVKIQVEFNPKEVASYRLVGYENRKLAHQDFNDDTKDAGEIGAGHSVTALYEIVPAGAKSGAPAVDKLKYQEEKPLTAVAKSGELMTVKIRYKKPDGDKSELSSFTITGDDRALDKTTPDFRFAAAVAEFGMLLRDSKHKGDATWAEVADLAKGSSESSDEHKAEFLTLVDTAKRLSNAKRGE
jgi:Ca-activated chloride channel family protein